MEVYSGLQRQHRVSKLQASTKYTFRLAAINNVGKRLVLLYIKRGNVYLATC
jgi:hypothetical protein